MKIFLLVKRHFLNAIFIFFLLVIQVSDNLVIYYDDSLNIWDAYQSEMKVPL